MKFTIYICSFCLMSFFVNAQEFHGEAEYFSKKITKQKSLKTEASKNEKADPEFEKALEAQEKLIDEINMPEVEYFKNEFLPAYYLTLDEHTKR